MEVDLIVQQVYSTHDEETSGDPDEVILRFVKHDKQLHRIYFEYVCGNEERFNTDSTGYIPFDETLYNQFYLVF